MPNHIQSLKNRAKGWNEFSYGIPNINNNEQIQYVRAVQPLVTTTDLYKLYSFLCLT